MFAKKPTLKNGVGIVTSPVRAVDQTLTNTVDAVNELVEKNPKLKKAITGKQIVVILPTGGGGTSSPPPSGPAPAPRTEGSGGSHGGNGSPAPVVSAEQSSKNRQAVTLLDNDSAGLVVSAEVSVAAPSSGPTVIALPVTGQAWKPAGEVAPDRRVYGPSQIREQNSAPKNRGPWVPIDHTNKEEFFAIEKVVNDTARKLGMETPKINSAYRDPSVGKHPSKRHAFAALDLATTDEKFAMALSEQLGRGYFVQVELVNVPEAGKQTNVEFYDGKRLPKVKVLNKIKAGGSHTHAHLCPDSDC